MSHCETDSFFLNNKFQRKDLHKLLTTVLLVYLQKILYKCENELHLILNKPLINNTNYENEYCQMDNRIIQHIIKQIVESGEYTLEGISFYTQIPYDIIYDAACGKTDGLSAPSWIRIVDIYLQVNPNIMHSLIRELLNQLTSCENNKLAISNLLHNLCSK